MKKLILIAGILVSLTAFKVVFGQTASGVIDFETKINLHRTLPPGREGMKSMIPEFRINKNQLFFNENESLYKIVIEDEEDEPQGNGVVMKFNMPNNEMYLNQAESKSISKEDFFGKTYLIEDSIKVPAWKIGTETKTIAGYECQMAYYTDESGPRGKQEITAWYTTKLRPFLGPERFRSLPGAVLALDINNGERVIIAKKIQLRELRKKELVVPTSGEKVTRAEFVKQRDEQMKKMGGSGGMIIRN